MDIGMKAFYDRPKQARLGISILERNGLHINHVQYYKKKWGEVEYFNARGDVTRRILKAFLYGVAGGFAVGCLLGFLLLRLDLMNPFSAMGTVGTILSVGVICAFVVPAFSTGLAAIFSENAVDVDESDFNGDQVVVDFHVNLKEREQAESLLKENGAHNILID